MYVMKSTREALLAQEKTIVTGDCCYLNPLMRRIVRFIGEQQSSSKQILQTLGVHAASRKWVLTEVDVAPAWRLGVFRVGVFVWELLMLCSCAAGVFAFGLFATDIFVNAGQVVTGGLSPYFLSVCKPNYTSSECRLNHQFITNGNICTGNPVVVENARRSFPSKDASLSVYSAVYVTVRRPAGGDQGTWLSSPASAPEGDQHRLCVPDVHHQHHQDQVQPPGQARPLPGNSVFSLPHRPQPGL